VIGGEGILRKKDNTEEIGINEILKSVEHICKKTLSVTDNTLGTTAASDDKIHPPE
jgi:hypothetical protein